MTSLTIFEAQARSALVAVDSYALDVDLTGGPEIFRTITTVRFRAAAPAAETFVEVRPVRLLRARLNGVALPVDSLARGRLPLPGLREQNELVVEAEFGYSHASEGVHRFVDPADGETYVYAQPAIAQAPAFMACFDQPDLKAPITVRVGAEPGWRVLATGVREPAADGRWHFSTTPPLATYLVTFAAGPFHGVVGEHDGIPLGLYARASLAEHLEREAPELFEVTAAAFDKYHELFGLRYPFGKYDQVFVPEFSWGAMEFPGCVLLRDELVFQSAVTEAQRARRAVLVAHEMAHMWFGNLVTMRWWDDLWLNESFADYLGWRVVAEATRWRTAWAAYGVGRKSWGLAADQRPSTHPVAAAEVADTDAALANFDGISYAKGSAVLRQLVTWVGEKAFLTGLRAYFDAHAFGNATLADLLAALSSASGRDLSGWAERWLRRPGVDTLWPETVPGPAGSGPAGADTVGSYAAGYVHQRPSRAGDARPHRVAIGVYQREGAAVVRRFQTVADIDPHAPAGRTAIAGLAGAPAGDLVLVNDEDLTYAKVRLAPSEQAALPEILPRIADPVTRALLWTSTWDACRDAEVAASALVDLALATLPGETEIALFSAVLDDAVDIADRYLAPSRREAAWRALGGACRAALAAAAPGGDRQLSAARGMVRCAGAGDAGWLAGWLDGVEVPGGLVVDQDLRWAVLNRLAVLGGVAEEVSQRIEDEAIRDRSARGEQEATWCRAARPDPAAKAAAWQSVTTDRTRSNRILVAAASGFWQPGQEELTAPYVGRYFDEIPETARWRSQQLLSAVAAAAYPAYAVGPSTLAAATATLDRADLHPVLRRKIVDATDDLRRALAARARGADK